MLGRLVEAAIEHFDQQLFGLAVNFGAVKARKMCCSFSLPHQLTWNLQATVLDEGFPCVHPRAPSEENKRKKKKPPPRPQKNKLKKEVKLHVIFLNLVGGEGPSRLVSEAPVGGLVTRRGWAEVFSLSI